MPSLKRKRGVSRRRVRRPISRRYVRRPTNARIARVAKRVFMRNTETHKYTQTVNDLQCFDNVSRVVFSSCTYTAQGTSDSHHVGNEITPIGCKFRYVLRVPPGGEMSYCIKFFLVSGTSANITALSGTGSIFKGVIVPGVIDSIDTDRYKVLATWQRRSTQVMANASLAYRNPLQWGSKWVGLRGKIKYWPGSAGHHDTRVALIALAFSDGIVTTHLVDLECHMEFYFKP